MVLAACFSSASISRQTPASCLSSPLSQTPCALYTCMLPSCSMPPSCAILSPYVPSTRLPSSCFKPTPSNACSQRRRLVIRNAASGSSGSNGTSRKEDYLPRMDPLVVQAGMFCPVPLEQQPINEFRMLLRSPGQQLRAEKQQEFLWQLGAISAVASALLGFPVASASFDRQAFPLDCLLTSLLFGQLAALFVTFRTFLRWSFVSQRLSSAKVEYEETGWYDGQVWMKPAEVLSRDRLLAAFEVNPIVDWLKTILITLSLSLVSTTAALFLLPSPPAAPPPTSTLSPTFPSPPLTNTAPYSEASARLFEPQAFESEGNEGTEGYAPADDVSGRISFQQKASSSASQFFVPGCGPAPLDPEEDEDGGSSSGLKRTSYRGGYAGYQFQYVSDPSPVELSGKAFQIVETDEDAIFDVSSPKDFEGKQLRAFIFSTEETRVGDAEYEVGSIVQSGPPKFLGVGVDGEGGPRSGVQISRHLRVGPNGELVMINE